VVARGVDHHFRQVAVRQLRQSLHMRTVGLDRDHFGNARELVWQKSKRSCRTSSMMQRQPANRTNSQTAKPIGPAPTITTVSPACGIPALHRVITDRQRLDQSQLIELQVVAHVQLPRWQDQSLAQAAVPMHADDLQVIATVAASTSRCKAVRGCSCTAQHCNDPRSADGNDVAATFQDFHTQFVTPNARIAEKGHLAQVSAIVGSANADLLHAKQDLPWARTALGSGTSQRSI
jgi:hypothetical protein